MKMSKFEKKFVNSKKHARGNIKKIELLFEKIDLNDIRSVLEVGCGAGILANYVAEKYQMKITGTDVDPAQIELAKEYHPKNDRLSFMVADAAVLPFGDSGFDMVLSIMVMHHINQWKKALGEISRVLKPGGFFIIKDICCSRLTSKALNLISANYGIYTYDDVTLFLNEENLNLLVQDSSRGILLKQFSLVLQKQIIEMV